MAAEPSGWAKAPDYSDQPVRRDRLRAQTRADQREYLEAGLRPVRCQGCGNQVRVRKNSSVHTSVQWTAEAVRRCPEFAAAADESGNTALIDTCYTLRDSIEQAVRDGTLSVADSTADTPTPAVPDA